MAFQLITLPISIIFVLVFAVASIAILYRMRRTARIYRFLFNATVIGIVALLVLFVYSILITLKA